MLAIPIQIEGIGYTDKIQHVFAYASLSFTVLIPLHRFQAFGILNPMKIMVLCAGYGLLLELIQYTFFPNRYFEWQDALANVIGVLIGGMLFAMVKRWLKTNQGIS